ncbi:MAG: hypothetical protein JWN93_1330 [Hyphomicrobiales bacterium]|nr:hypothetical protein [Hyphomicrobiales bacterium]
MAGHVLVVFGTRPEGIKMIPVVKALRQSPYLRTTVATTGQHREMLEQVFVAFDERPDVDLALMSPGQSLAGITAGVVEKMCDVLAELRPELMLVHGDTTTAMAAAIAGFYTGCRIGHVEAGLRSHDLKRPWPEEFNRVTIDAVSDLMFAPTQKAKLNLSREYNQKGRVFVTGNTGIDALMYMSQRIETSSALKQDLDRKYGFLDQARNLVLVTGHRRESFGEGFRRICEGLASVVDRGDAQVLYPVHLNPNVRTVVGDLLGGRPNVNRSLHLIDPVDYVDMVYLMNRARLIITDSGGIQEEGPALGKPVLVMRDVTERPEALSTGVVKLIGTDPRVMREEVDRLLSDERAYAAAARRVFPYGDGTAARQIVRIIEQEFAQ